MRGFRRYADRLPLRKHFYLKMGRDGFPKEEIDAALERLRQTVERMDRALGQSEWLANDMFTLADISIMPSIVRMEDLGLVLPLGRLAECYPIGTRVCSERPAFSKTYFPGARELSAKLLTVRNLPPGCTCPKSFSTTINAPSTRLTISVFGRPIWSTF